MQVTLAQIAAAMPVFNSLVGAKLPVKSAFRVAKLGRAVGQEFVLYEQQRVVLVKRLGEPVEGTDGDFEIKNSEKLVEFLNEMQPLNDTEVPIDASPLRLEDLGSLELTVAEMSILEPFIVVEAQEA